MIGSNDVLDDDDFAAAVLDLYDRILKDIPEQPRTNIPKDVAEVAFPLAVIGEALDLLMQNLSDKPAPCRIKRSGIIPTLHLFDALLSGANHPFWRYATIMQKSITHRRPPSKVERARRTIAVGLLRALMRALGPRTETRAGRMIETECRKHGMVITRRQLAEWNTDLARDAESDRGADRLQTIQQH